MGFRGQKLLRFFLRLSKIIIFQSGSGPLGKHRLKSLKTRMNTRFFVVSADLRHSPVVTLLCDSDSKGQEVAPRVQNPYRRTK